MQRDRERREKDSSEVAAPVADRPPAKAPRERQGPLRPQLRPHAEPRPHVGVLLVPDPGGAHQERGHRGRSGRRPAARAEQAGRNVDADRPQRKKQIQRPAKRHVRSGQQTDRAGEDRGEALIVQELRRPLTEEREPARERHVPGAQLRRRETHHLLVQRAVVQVRNPDRQSPQTDEVPTDRGRDQQPRPPRSGPAPGNSRGPDREPRHRWRPRRAGAGGRHWINCCPNSRAASTDRC